MTKDLGQAATKLQQLLRNSQDQLSKEREKVRTLQDQLQDKVQTSYVLIKLYRTNSCMPVLTLFVLFFPGGWWRAEARHFCLKCKQIAKNCLKITKMKHSEIFLPFFLLYYSPGRYCLKKSNSCKLFISEMCWTYFHFTFHLKTSGYVRKYSSTALYI